MHLPEIIPLIADPYPLAVVLTDAEGKILYANPAFEHMCGYHPHEYTGRKPSFLQGKKTNTITAQQMGRKIAAGEKSTTRLLNYHKDGHTYFVDIFCFPIKNKAGEIEYFMSIEREVQPQAGRPKQHRQIGDLPHWATNLL